MIEINDLPFSEIERGYLSNESGYTCVFCGDFFQKGEVFKIDDKFYEAKKAIEIHLKYHHNIVEELLNISNKQLSFTSNQIELLKMFSNGFSDNEIAKQMKLSPSTIRHQRFTFREKAKNAKLYLALWNTVNKSKNDKKEFISLHEGAKMVDDRYIITNEENDKVLSVVFSSLEPLKLKIFSKKEKKKIIILRKIAQQFEKNIKYSEKEVNEILKAIYDDFVTIRRYLIEYGYMDRTSNCEQYWKK